MKGSNMEEAISAIEGLIKKSKPGTSTTMRSAIVGLFTADAEGELRYSNCIGLLQLDIDRQLKTQLLRLYNIETIAIVFEVELYYGFAKHYKMISSTFYTFEYPRGMIGLLFRNKDEAELMKVKIQTSAPQMKEFDELKKKRVEEEKQRKKDGSFFNKLKKGIFGSEEQKEVSSVVVEVHKEKSISFDLTTGTFNTEHIPPEWQELFDNLNLSKEDLKDKEVVNIIVQETIMQQMKNQAENSLDRELQKKFKEADQEDKAYMEAYRKSRATGLPPPPPPPPLLLVPEALNSDPRTSMSNKRANLMDEIRNNKVKLKHVETSSGGIDLDLTNMNKEDRMDHAERLRQKLKMRKNALNRRKASESDSD